MREARGEVLSAERPSLSRSAAITFVVLLGVMSLLADLTYEGARSVSGPYLAILGASATVVGIAAGLGELVGYTVRLLSGYLADRTGRYWATTILGYTVNLLAVPLLALAGHWAVAAGLIVAERVGKAIRTPARDAMLSHATRQTGRGWGFGLHEAMDQVGAVLGPLSVAGVLALQGQYQLAFALLLLPALAALGTLLVARQLYPRPRDFDPTSPTLDPQGLPRAFWLYLVAAALVAAGYADFALIAYHFEQQAVLPAPAIPLLYALAMAIDAVAALLFGWLFDRFGLAVVGGAVVLSAGFAPLVFSGSAGLALIGMALWGAGMGAQESVLRAAVAELVPSARRGTGYGLFNSGYGVCWFLGSAVMGVLYDRSVTLLAVFSVVAQLSALPVLMGLLRQRPHAPS
ncbi:MAG: MFS transporter [Dehalococcoidia bacterium]|nr:MAG: MFS transporter [Dehalococcoidia bacterium]